MELIHQAMIGVQELSLPALLAVQARAVAPVVPAVDTTAQEAVPVAVEVVDNNHYYLFNIFC
jgi:hypothetical protein